MRIEKYTPIDIDHATSLFLDTREALSARISGENINPLNTKLRGHRTKDTNSDLYEDIYPTIYANLGESNVLYLGYRNIRQINNKQFRWGYTSVGIFVENGKVSKIVSYKVNEAVGGNQDPDAETMRNLISFNWDTLGPHEVADLSIRAEILLTAASTMDNYLNHGNDTIRNMHFALKLPVDQVRPAPLSASLAPTGEAQ